MLIGKTIDREEGHNLAIFGMGNLGRAVTRFIRKNEARMNIVAGFDIDSSKINQETEGVPCYHISHVREQIKQKGIDIAVLTSSPEAAQGITDVLVESGVKGILNFTSEHLDVPPTIYLKNYDIMTSLEEIGFFIKTPGGNSKN
jgi:redox-sensing transcriptional repressor